MMKWLEKARVGCVFCAEVAQSDKLVFEMCGRRDEHQRTAAKMADVEREVEDSLAGQISDMDAEIDKAGDVGWRAALDAVKSAVWDACIPGHTVVIGVIENIQDRIGDLIERGPADAD